MFKFYWIFSIGIGIFVIILFFLLRDYYKKWDNIEEYIKKIPKTNMIPWTTAFPNGYIAMQEKRKNLFHQEVICKITQAKVEEIQTSQKIQQLCPYPDYIFLKINVTTQTNNQFLLLGIQSFPKDCNIEGGGPQIYSLDTIKKGDVLRNIAVDKNNFFLDIPSHEISYDKYEKIDISHLPECSPNVQ